MFTITEALIAEHAVFCALFDQVERALPDLRTIEEVKLLTSLVKGLLEGHSETETDLAYVALDHVLEDRGELDRLHEDHREIDVHLARAQAAVSFDQALRLLREALFASRAHFRREEQAAFPLIDQVLHSTTLEQLGRGWMQRYLEQPRPTTATPCSA